MKKAVGGCLIVVLLALVLGGGGFWWFVLRPAWNTGSELVAAAQQWAELVKIDSRIHNHDEFMPPSDGVIDESALQRFIAVQQTMNDRMGDNLKRLDTKYRALQSEHKADGRQANMQEIVAAYGDVFDLLKQTRTTQIDALNEEDFSLAEYRWVRNQAYSALGISVAALAQGKPEDASANPNAAALKPHRDLLLRTAATVWLDF
jgi:hypothetical protein